MAFNPLVFRWGECSNEYQRNDVTSRIFSSNDLSECIVSGAFVSAD